MDKTSEQIYREHCEWCWSEYAALRDANGEILRDKTGAPILRSAERRAFVMAREGWK